MAQAQLDHRPLKRPGDGSLSFRIPLELLKKVNSRTPPTTIVWEANYILPPKPENRPPNMPRSPSPLRFCWVIKLPND